KACKGDHLNGVNAPFWQNWPLTEPYIIFGPEALHYFPKMFWDHDLQWAINLVGTTELDFRFTLLQPFTGYHQFKEGVSVLRSPSGQDHCIIQCYIIGVIAGAVLWECLIAMDALNEFQYHAQASCFEEGDVTRLQSILKEFHDKKASIINTEAQQVTHWEIPKLELLQSVATSIHCQGAPMQWTADYTEHAHVRIVKEPVCSGNKWNMYKQICQYLNRQNKCSCFSIATTIHQ
ncbi:hypothetical protein EDC04DRAFT_2543707, partial [Pisolithus marmoratus]